MNKQRKNITIIMLPWMHIAIPMHFNMHVVQPFLSATMTPKGHNS